MEPFRFSSTRVGLTRKIDCGLDVYLTVNTMPNGEPGEVYIKLGKQGSTVSGLMHAWAVTISAALQRGVPWQELREKFVGSRFEPNAHQYSSLVDAVAQNVDEMIAELHILGDEHHGQKQLDFDDAD